MAGAPLGNSNRSAIKKPRKKVQDDIRAKIQAGGLITRLKQHIEGKKPLENSQLKAIEILLDRSVPKLSAVQHSGDKDNPVAVTFGWRTT